MFVLFTKIMALLAGFGSNPIVQEILAAIVHGQGLANILALLQALLAKQTPGSVEHSLVKNCTDLVSEHFKKFGEPQMA